MRFWDSSALVALFVAQRNSADLRELYAADSEVLAWTLSDVELRSALARLGREGSLRPSDLQTAVMRVEEFWGSVHVVSLVDAVKGRAKRILAVHPLTAADALQLGAAVAASFDEPLGFEFVCLDEGLAEAARREGFSVLP